MTWNHSTTSGCPGDDVCNLDPGWVCVLIQYSLISVLGKNVHCCHSLYMLALRANLACLLYFINTVDHSERPAEPCSNIFPFGKTLLDLLFNWHCLSWVQRWLKGHNARFALSCTPPTGGLGYSSWVRASPCTQLFTRLFVYLKVATSEAKELCRLKRSRFYHWKWVNLASDYTLQSSGTVHQCYIVQFQESRGRCGNNRHAILPI